MYSVILGMKREEKESVSYVAKKCTVGFDKKESEKAIFCLKEVFEPSESGYSHHTHCLHARGDRYTTDKYIERLDFQAW